MLAKLEPANVADSRHKNERISQRRCDKVINHRTVKRTDYQEKLTIFSFFISNLEIQFNFQQISFSVIFKLDRLSDLSEYHKCHYRRYSHIVIAIVQVCTILDGMRMIRMKNVLLHPIKLVKLENEDQRNTKFEIKSEKTRRKKTKATKTMGNDGQNSQSIHNMNFI